MSPYQGGTFYYKEVTKWRVQVTLSALIPSTTFNQPDLATTNTYTYMLHTPERYIPRLASPRSAGVQHVVE